MDLKSCSRCGRIHPRGFKCNVGRKYVRTEEKRLRSQYSWTQKAKQIKEDAQGLCEVCRKQGILTYNNLEVHHITKLSEEPEGLLEDDNLICLCVRHHKEADNGEIDADYLREIARERMK
jgi:5-methylcytosine-specific restriction endonuclease McrA